MSRHSDSWLNVFWERRKDGTEHFYHWWLSGPLLFIGICWGLVELPSLWDKAATPPSAALLPPAAPLLAEAQEPDPSSPPEPPPLPETPILTIVIRASNEAKAKAAGATRDLWVANPLLQSVAAEIDQNARAAYQDVWYKVENQSLTIYLHDIAASSWFHKSMAQRLQTELICMSFQSQHDQLCSYQVTRHEGAWTQRANEDIHKLLVLYSLLRYPTATAEHVAATQVLVDQAWQEGWEGNAPQQQVYSVIVPSEIGRQE